MEINAELQEEIDALFKAWKQEEEPFVSEEDACEQFEDLALELEEWVSVEQRQDWEWYPEKANRLSHSVSKERVAELAEGAALTEEEERKWINELESCEPYLEIVNIYSLRSSEGELAWITLSQDGNHQGTQLIDGSGPFFSLESLAKFLAPKVREWDTWDVSGLPGDQEAERFEALLTQYAYPADNSESEDDGVEDEEEEED